MAKDRHHNSEVEQAVEDIASQFYTEPPKKEPHPLESYVSFSESHRGSQQVLVGVSMLLALIVLVWGIVWYQSLQHVPLMSQSESNLISDVSDDFEAIFEDIAKTEQEAQARSAEASLKSELTSAITTEQEVLGSTVAQEVPTPTLVPTSTTTLITPSTTPNSTTTPEIL